MYSQDYERKQREWEKSGNKGDEPMPLEFESTLRRVKENETKLNAVLMKQKSGETLRFGDTIQLLHVCSGKFLSVDPSNIAETERENLRCYLDKDGTPYSCFTVLPGSVHTQEVPLRVCAD